MKRISKRNAQKEYPEAFKGVGGCDPIVLEIGGKYYVKGRQLLLNLGGITFQWRGREKFWDEEEEEMTTIPKELANLVKTLPGMKFTTSPTGWTGSVKISEKRRKEQTSFYDAWDRTRASLNKKPWKRATESRSGWNGQTDTSGNYSENSAIYVHPSGLNVMMKYNVSFTTGTKVWSVYAWFDEK